MTHRHTIHQNHLGWDNSLPPVMRIAPGTSLEFEVADVDQEYSRLQTIVKHWVKPPTAQPWGTRSIYFRDPDGNLIDFYAWVKPRASDLRP